MAAVREWLKRHYRDAEASGPQCKRVRFCEIFEEVVAELPVVNNSVLSQAIREEFPNSMSKRVGVQRQTYVYGIEKDAADETPLGIALRSNQLLQQQVEQLQQQVTELKKESASKLGCQMKSLAHPNKFCHHGPDTVAHLESFSLDTITEEIKENAPDVIELLQQLGDSSRHSDDLTDSAMEEPSSHLTTLRSTMALCTLVKCRSAKVLGLQLFLSIMFIARATHKQVRKAITLRSDNTHANLGDNRA